MAFSNPADNISPMEDPLLLLIVELASVIEMVSSQFRLKIPNPTMGFMLFSEGNILYTPNSQDLVLKLMELVLEGYLLLPLGFHVPGLLNLKTERANSTRKLFLISLDISNANPGPFNLLFPFTANAGSILISQLLLDSWAAALAPIIAKAAQSAHFA